MAWYVVSSDEGSTFSVDQIASSGEYQMSIARWVSEAEANIIAFALNAVAEGMVLSAVPTRFNIMPASPGHKRVQIYDGPTEGVAP